MQRQCGTGVAVSRSSGGGSGGSVGKQQQSTVLRHLRQCMLDTGDSIPCSGSATANAQAPSVPKRSPMPPPTVCTFKWSCAWLNAASCDSFQRLLSTIAAQSAPRRAEGAQAETGVS